MDKFSTDCWLAFLLGWLTRRVRGRTLLVAESWPVLMDALTRVYELKTKLTSELEELDDRQRWIDERRQQIEQEVGELMITERVLRRIFVSYSSEDAPTVSALRESLAHETELARPNVDDREGAIDQAGDILIKDAILDAVRLVYPQSLTRTTIALTLEKVLHRPVSERSITTTLGRWKNDGRVRLIGKHWQYVPVEHAVEEDNGHESDLEADEPPSGGPQGGSNAREATVLEEPTSLWSNP